MYEYEPAEVSTSSVMVVVEMLEVEGVWRTISNDEGSVETDDQVMSMATPAVTVVSLVGEVIEMAWAAVARRRAAVA